MSLVPPAHPSPAPPIRHRLARLIPATLFGRLAMLLFVVVIVSHALVLTVLFEFMGPPAMADRPPPSGPAAADTRPGRQGEPAGPRGPAGGPPDESLPEHLLNPGMLFDITVRLLALLLATWVGARWLSQPIQRLADAARDLGRDINGPPLEEQGTTECREATKVFNRMKLRIQRQIADRDRFVAAVSHDLRTPLTRLRLRTETLEHAGDRLAFQRDIAEMDLMIRDTLDYLMGAAEGERAERFDIAALVRSMADDHADAGEETEFTVRGHAAPLEGQPRALKRCVGNLVENALRYGGSAEVALVDTPASLTIRIADRGPGVPEHELEKLTQPFYRVESSRNRHSGGVGLGLSIVREIAERHGGHLALSNRPGGGLIAELRFPRGRAAA